MTSLAYLGDALVLLAGGVLGRFAPSVGLAAVLIAVPLRIDFLESAHAATLLLVGVALGRSREIVRVLASERLFLCATLAFPAWALASIVWARQPLFVWELLGKWLAVVLAAWVAAADRTKDPRAAVAVAFVAMVPHAAWALLERLHLVRPLGDPEVLRFRLIEFQGVIRGRGFFWHPNRLGEFVEQVALVLAGAGLFGVWPLVCLVGVAVALAGAWGTGSTGTMAALGGGLVLLVGLVALSRRAGRIEISKSVAIVSLALAGAAAVGAFAWWSHGGLGPRFGVFRFALRLIDENPVLGIGAGNWALAVGGEGPDLPQGWFRSHAHSLLLHVGAELGVVGSLLVTLFFVGPIWSAAWRLGDAPRGWRGIGIGAAFGVAALFAHNLVHYFLRDAVDGIVTGLLLGTVVAVARRGPAAPP